MSGWIIPDTLTVFYQAAKFFNNSKVWNYEAETRIGKCLLDTDDKGLTHDSDLRKGLEIFADNYFSEGLDKDITEDPESVHPRTGFIIKHAGFPNTWKPKLQTEIALSTTEA